MNHHATVEYARLARRFFRWENYPARTPVTGGINADPRNHFGKHALRRFDK